MDLTSYVRALRTNWIVLVALGLVGAVLGTALYVITPPVYAGSVTFFATTPSTTDGNPLQGDQFGQQRVNSYVKLLRSQRLAELVAEESGIEVSTSEIMQSTQGQADLNTVLFTATVSSEDQDQAFALAQAISTAFPALVNEIETDGGDKPAPVSLTVVSGPSVSADPVSPRLKINVGLGLMLGLVAGALAAIARTTMDRSVRSEDEAREATGTPVLGHVPFDPKAGASTLIIGDARKSVSVRSEAYRVLRTNLQFVDAESPVAVLVVSSTAPSEGKSVTSANLAVAFASAGRRVLLIDADMRKPTQARIFGLESSIGLSTVLAGQVSLDDAVQPWGQTGLSLMACGSIPPNPSELLGSRHMDELVAAVRHSFDIVIIDTPPVMAATDAAVVATKADGVLLVVRHGKTRNHELKRATDALRAVDARVLGTVVNRSPSHGADAYAYQQYVSEHETSVTAKGRVALPVPRGAKRGKSAKARS